MQPVADERRSRTKLNSLATVGSHEILRNGRLSRKRPWPPPRADSGAAGDNCNKKKRRKKKQSIYNIRKGTQERPVRARKSLSLAPVVLALYYVLCMFALQYTQFPLLVSHITELKIHQTIAPKSPTNSG